VNIHPRCRRFPALVLWSALTLVLAGSLTAEAVIVTIFQETMGNVGGTTTIAAHEAANGFDNDTYFMSTGGVGVALAADLRATSVSAGYTNAAGNAASGLANVFFGAASSTRGFSIQNIDTLSYSNLALSFAYRKESASSNAMFSAQWSTNSGADWTSITVTGLPAANAGTGWTLLGEFALPAEIDSTDLWLRWVMAAGSGALRIDDVLLRGEPPPGSSVPTVTGPSVANVTTNSATLGGEITFDGNEDITERGVYYSTVTGFTPPGAGIKVSESGLFGVGPFGVNVSGLDPNTHYYFRAFASNSVGIAFSSESSFRTLRMPPENSLVYFTFTGDSPAPEFVDADITSSNFSVSAGSLAYEFTSASTWTALGGENPVVEGAAGWTASSQAAAKHFRFTLNANAGSVFSITNISLLKRATSAGPSAMGFSINGASVHQQNQAADTTEALSVPISGYTLLQTAQIQIEGWTNGSRATAGSGAFRVENVTVQGVVEPEPSANPPTVEDPTVSNITVNSAMLGGDVTDDGGAPVTQRGAYWSTSPGFVPPGEGARVFQAGSFGVGVFSVNATGLPHTATIYFRAFALNLGGEGYSDESSFATPSPPPTLTVPAGTNVFILNTLRFRVSATEPDGDEITLDADDVPANAAFYPTNGFGSAAGTFEFTPAAAQSGAVYTVRFTAEDQDGAVTQSVVITVLGLGNPNLDCNILSDDFEDGDLAGWTESAVGTWTNSDSAPLTGLRSLKHNLVAATATTNDFIYAQPAYELADGDTTWRLTHRNGALDPSGNNRFWAYLMADGPGINPTSATANGYAVGVNLTGTDDLLSLYRVDNGVATRILASALNWDANMTVGIQVNRTTAGDWELLYSPGGGFVQQYPAGTVADTTHTDTSVFGLVIQYTSSQAGLPKYDDICISQAGGGGDGDDDNDGIPDAWEDIHCGGDCDPDADTGTGDGLTYIQAYLLDFDPAVSNAPFAIVDFSLNSPLTLQFDSTNSRMYTVEYTTNLVDGAGWTTLLGPQPGSNGTFTATDDNATVPTKDYRIKVQAP
jgi:hypothetical protein